MAGSQFSWDFFVQTPQKVRRGSGAASLAASTTSTQDEDGYSMTAQVGREVFMLGFKVRPL